MIEKVIVQSFGNYFVFGVGIIYRVFPHDIFHNISVKLMVGDDVCIDEFGRTIYEVKTRKKLKRALIAKINPLANIQSLNDLNFPTY